MGSSLRSKHEETVLISTDMQFNGAYPLPPGYSYRTCTHTGVAYSGNASETAIAIMHYYESFSGDYRRLYRCIRFMIAVDGGRREIEVQSMQVEGDGFGLCRLSNETVTVLRSHWN